jgi:pyrroloquinoline quinone (PQQ) biosynthesis protein C
LASEEGLDGSFLRRLIVSTASELINALRNELRPLSEKIRNHPYIGLLESGNMPRDRLSLIAGEQYHTIRNDLRSFGLLLSREQDTRLMRFVVGNIDYEAAAFDALFDFAHAIGMTEAELQAYQPMAGSHAYTAFLATTAAYGTVPEMAAAYVIDLEGWGGNCGAISLALRGNYGFEASGVRFFDHFAAEDPDFERQSLEVIDIGLAGSADSLGIRRTVRLMLEYELMYWDALHEASKPT